MPRRASTRGGSQQAAANLQFILRPGGAPSANVYTTWASLAAAAASSKVPVTIVFDDSLVSPVEIGPAGNYVLPRGTTWRGIAYANVAILDGVTLDGPGGYARITDFVDLYIDVQGTGAPVCTISAVEQELSFVRTYISASGTQPFLRFTGTDTTINLTDAGFIADATEVVDLDMVNPADALYIRGGEGGFIEADTISGTATSDLVPINSASSANVFTTQTNVLGTTFNLYFSYSNSIIYTAATPADWGAPPFLVKEALDRIAAALAILIPGPIP